MQRPEPSAVRRVLLTRLRYLGDVVLTTPAIAAFRAGYPEARITYLTEPDGAAALEHNPNLDEIIVWEDGLLGQLRCIRRLRGGHFDVAVDLFSNPRSALLTFLTGARWRLGYRRGPRGLIYSMPIETAGEVPAVETHLRAARTLGLEAAGLRTEIHLDADDWLWGKRFVAAEEAGEAPIVGLFPGGKWPAKRWSLERFARLGDRLVEELGAQVYVFFGPYEEEDVHPYTSMVDGRQFVCRGQTVRELIRIIACCDLLVSNDGGPMHIGPAVGTATLAIFGPTEPEIWFPYGEQDGHRVLTHNVDCSPCHRHYCEEPTCLEAISLEEVFAACREILAGRACEKS
jgi:ADP-heptose:LPS heptosyltransferase